MFRICFNQHYFHHSKNENQKKNRTLLLDRSTHSMKHSEAIMFSQDEPNDDFFKTALLTAGLGVISLGMLLGVKIVFRREQAKLTRREARDGGMMAAKALGLATLLCTGSFAGAGALFITVTGITSVKEFGEVVRNILQKTGLQPALPAPDKESVEIESSLENFFQDLFTLQPLKTETENNKVEEVSSKDSKGFIEDLREQLREKFGKSSNKSKQNTEIESSLQLEKSLETEDGDSKAINAEDKGMIESLRQSLREKFK